MITKHYMFIIYFTFSSAFLAQNKELQFDHITTENGLSNNSIWGILQDSQGFMWFGTNGGLHRWDGNEFKIFTHDPNDSLSLSNNRIVTIMEDSKDFLWIGTQYGLNKFDKRTEKFTRYIVEKKLGNLVERNYIWSIIEMSDGTIWFGGNCGLYKLAPGLNEMQSFLPDSSSSYETRYANHIFSFCEVNNTQLMVGTANGLFKFNTTKKSFTKITFGNPKLDRLLPIHKVYADPKGTLWIGTANIGLIKYHLESKKYYQYISKPDDPYSINRSAIVTIFEDYNGELWIGTVGGLNRFDPKTNRFNLHKHKSNAVGSLSSSRISSIFRDRDLNLWVGTWDNGINKFSKWKNTFAHFKYNTEDPTGLGKGEVVGLCDDKNGDIWIAHWGGGVSHYNHDSEKFMRYFSNRPGEIRIRSIWVSSIYEDRSGNILVGSKGLDIININTKKVVYFKSDPTNFSGMQKGNVSVLYEDSHGIIWLGFLNNGLDRFDRNLGIFNHYGHDPLDTLSLSDDHVLSIVQDMEENIWIGTKNGLNRIIDSSNEKIQFVRYSNEESDIKSISHNCVYNIFEDSKHRLWIGTEYGLNLYDSTNNGFISYTKDDGLQGNIIYSILEDDKNNLWLRTNTGLTKFIVDEEIFKNYDERDGLIDCRAVEFGHKAFHKGKNGKIFIGGYKSVAVFHPDSLKDNPNPPQIVFTDFNLKNKSVKIGEGSYLKRSITFAESVELPYYESSFSFEFTALDYTVSDKNKFAYRLEGFDEDWIYTDASNRIAHYTNIDPGEYIFRVKGSNNDGVWNEEGASVKIIILPPWWATWWFRSIAVLILFLVGYLIYKYRVNQLLALERMRVQIASDLHDDVGSSLTKIAIHSEIIKNTEDKNKVSSSSAKIGIMSREIISSLSDIIWSIDARNDKVGDLIDRMRDYLESVFPTGQVTTNFQTHGIIFANSIDQELRQNIYLIFKEAVNNTSKHSDATEIKIRMTNGGGKFSLEISDNGKGIEFDGKRSHSHGLQNMKLRAQRINGELKIENDDGTKIILIVKEL